MCSSSYHVASLGFYRDCVAKALGERNSDAFEPLALPLFPDVHVISSCLQKSLRRGDVGVALTAARLLLRLEPERLWRRLCVCAFEEFGLVDLSMTARVVAVSQSRAFRALQGEERVLVHLIERLCASPKDRRLDDLYALGSVVQTQPEQLRSLEEGPLAAVVAPLVHQTARLIGSCERAVPRRSFRAIAVQGCETALRTMLRDGLVDEGLAALCLAGVRQSRCLLPMLLPLAIEATESCGGLGEAVAVALPAVPSFGGMPAYAFDGFTRLGREVLVKLGKSEPRLMALTSQLPAAARLDVLHHLLFFAEGGLCSPLVRDELALELNRHALAFGTRLPSGEAEAALALMRELLPSVHALRQAVVPAARTFPKEDHL
jgi:hypothetical protein